MKIIIQLLAILLILFSYACESNINSSYLEDDSLKLRKLQETNDSKYKTSICDDYIGGPQDGSPDGCSSTGCQGLLHITISNLQCENDDCYFTFRKSEPNYGPENNFTTNYPCSYNNWGDICFDQEGTYTFVVDLNSAGIPAGDPNYEPNHRYYINPLLGYWPDNTNNSVDISWSGAVNGSVTYTSINPSPESLEKMNNIIPTGECN